MSKKGPYIKVVIYNPTKNTTTPLQVIYIIYTFQFSLKSI